MKQIDWNEASRQGLIERINTEILHPLGLAMCRTPEDGTSPGLLIAEDGKWEYAQGEPGILPTVTAERDALQLRLNVADQRVDDLQVEVAAALSLIGRIVIAGRAPLDAALDEWVESLRRDAERYRFVSRLAWYVARAASVYALDSIGHGWAKERRSTDEDEVEAAIDATMASALPLPR